MSDLMSFICPNPSSWNEVYKKLCKKYEKFTNTKLPLITTEIYNVGGPPTPLILNGWVLTNDTEKHERWIDTINWAEKYNLLHIISIDEKDQYKPCDSNVDDYVDSFTKKIVNQHHLDEFVMVSDYKLDVIQTINKIPDSPGLYFVIYDAEIKRKSFLKIGTAGFFKGKDPNVSIEELNKKWVNNADILYIGKAGGKSVNGVVSNATLRKRIKTLLEFGDGQPAAHWGGRYLWQHMDSAKFKIYWYDTTKSNLNPVELEKRLIYGFEQKHGKKPFANLR